jgi:hypothetical protein
MKPSACFIAFFFLLGATAQNGNLSGEATDIATNNDQDVSRMIE